MLVNLPVTAWSKAILHNILAGLAGTSAYVDDKVIRSIVFKHIEVLLERTVHFDRLAGQFLNSDKSMSLCTYKKRGDEAQIYNRRGHPATYIQDAKTLGAMVASAARPSSFIAKKRVDAAVLSVKRLQELPIYFTKKAFSSSPK